MDANQSISIGELCWFLFAGIVDQMSIKWFVIFFPSWLQPNRAVDPEASELKLPCSTPSVGLPAEFQVLMKDQKLKPIHVEGMKVVLHLFL